MKFIREVFSEEFIACLLLIVLVTVAARLWS